MFIATVPPGHRQLRRSGMFIGIATNNGLRKLRQERHVYSNGAAGTPPSSVGAACL